MTGDEWVFAEYNLDPVRDGLDIYLNGIEQPLGEVLDLAQGDRITLRIRARKGRQP